MVHFTLPATAAFLLTSSLVLGISLPDNTLTERADQDGDVATLTDSPNPKAIAQFYYGDSPQASQICSSWMQTTNSTLSQDPDTAKIFFGCVVPDTADKIMAAYSTQVKKDGSICELQVATITERIVDLFTDSPRCSPPLPGLHTAAIGHRMDLTPVTTKQNGANCPGTEAAPGYCAIVNPPTAAVPMGALPGTFGGTTTDPPQTSGARKIRSVFGLLFQ